MADEPQTPNADDELVLTQDDQVTPDDEQGEEEEVVTFGEDETEPKDTDTGLVKHLREEIRRARAEAAEARKSAPGKPVEVGPKPTLWDDDIAGDEDKYDAAMLAWNGRKVDADRQTATATEQTEEQQKIMAARLENVAKAKAALNRPDADEAFENVKAVLGEERAAAIVMIADTEEAAAKLIYALGNHPDRLAELAAEQDPLRFVKQIAKLEGQVKTVKRKRVIEPDTPEKGSGKISRETADKTLAKLEAEADRTNDRTQVIAYKRKLKDAAKG